MYLRHTSATVLSTNVIDASLPVFDIASNYAKNTIIVSDTQIYRSLKDDNMGNLPLYFPVFWKLEGTINTLAAFDPHFFTQSVAQDEIIYLISAPAVDTIAFANLEASEIVIELLDIDDNIIETKTSGLISVNGINWINYWFNPLSHTTRDVIYIPIAVSDKIRIRIKNPGALAKVGNIGIGMRTIIGCEIPGTRVSQRLVRDPWGEMKTILDVSLSIGLDTQLRISTGDELSHIGDKFSFFFFGDDSEDIVCAKITNNETTDNDEIYGILNLELEGIK